MSNKIHLLFPSSRLLQSRFFKKDAENLPFVNTTSLACYSFLAE